MTSNSHKMTRILKSNFNHPLTIFNAMMKSSEQHESGKQRATRLSDTMTKLANRLSLCKLQETTIVFPMHTSHVNSATLHPVFATKIGFLNRQRG